MKTILTFLLLCSTALAVDYPIVYVRAPRYGDGTQAGDRRSSIPEVDHPINLEIGSDLAKRNADGSVEVLVDSGEHGAILDPKPSLDGTAIYFSWITDARPAYSPAHGVQGHTTGADIYRLDVATVTTTRLTHQERETNAAYQIRVPWAQQKIYNLGACPLPDGRVMFTSNRNDLAPNGNGGSFPCLQLFVMDEDGRNVEQIGYFNLGSALHPVLLKDGRVMFSSAESQGNRLYGLWSLWSIYPDGRNWDPIVFGAPRHPGLSFHWQAQRTDGDLALVEYYAQNNSGFGALFGMPPGPPPASGLSTTSISAFGHPEANLNPLGYAFERYGMYRATPWTTSDDVAAAAGKVSMPSAAPGNALLVNYTPGPANNSVAGPPFIDSGIYLMNGKTTAGPGDLELVLNDPNYNELQPHALVPWTQIYGTEPVTLPELPHAEHPKLPKGTPFGLVGTSSFYKRETYSANLTVYGSPTNWALQGSNATVNGVEFDSALIDRVRILAQEPTTFDAFGRGFLATGLERIRVLGEVPLRKASGLLDADGNPDTSFLARIPADVSFTFQLVGTDGLSLTTAQTWHQLRPGEVRWNCNGCHAHHAPATQFAGTAASKPEYNVADLTKTNEVWTKEFFRDVWPVLEAKCDSCHSGETPAGGFTANYLGVNNHFAFGYSARTSQVYLKAKDGHPAESPLTAAELLTLAQWIDLGMQREARNPYLFDGALADDSKPIVALDSPRRKEPSPLTLLRFGAHDYFSGLASRSVKASWTVNGRAAGEELADLFTSSDSVWTLPLNEPFTGEGKLTVVATDTAGNVQRVVRDFETGDEAPVDPCAALAAQVAALQAQIAALQSQDTQAQSQIQSLQADVASLQAKIAAIKALLQ